MQKAIEFAERVFDGLVSKPMQTVGALVIFLIALPLIKKGLRDKPASIAPPAPSQSPIQIESAWFLQTVTRIQMDIEATKEQLGVLSGQVAGVAQLIRRQAKRDAVAKAKAARAAAKKD